MQLYNINGLIICSRHDNIERSAQGVRGSRRKLWCTDSYRRHKSERFFRSSRPGYPHPVCSELGNIGFRWMVSNLSVTERRRWHQPYQTDKTIQLYICTQKHYNHNEDGRTAPGVRGHGSVPMSHLGNVVTRTGLQRTESEQGLNTNIYQYTIEIK